MKPLRALLPLLFLASGCQTVFGDFEETPTPPARVIDCNTREYRCNGARLERCKDDRSGFELAEQCASENACNLKTQSCAPCQPGEFQCQGANLQQCSDGVWQTQAPCASPALCDAPGGKCVMQVCAAGELRCSGVAELLRCAPELDRFERVELCGSYALCTATLANATESATVRCAAPACADGEYSCDGATLRRCNTDRTGWDTVMTCGSESECSARAGACVACSQGECNHGVHRSCLGGSWGDEQTCATAALCEPDNGCIAPECDAPGSVRCAASGDSTNLELCTDDLRWKVLESCGPEPLCDAENRRCLPQGCTPLAGRCLGDTYQECDLDGVSFVSVSECAPGACDPVAGCGAPCTSGFRCNDVHIEECVGGVWQRRDTCATPELCNAGATPRCFAPLCGSYLGQSSCLEANFRVCRPGRNDWQLSDVCVSNAMCNAGLPTPPIAGASPSGDERVGFGPGGCTCTPGRVYCEGAERVLCNGDGLTQTRLETCPASCVIQGQTAICG